MATLLVPYNTAMQLGSGFNSFTQTLCVDHAVVRDDQVLAEIKKEEKPNDREIAQSVTYKTSVIDKTTDVTDEMNINGAFKIKYDQLKVDGSGGFVNTNKIKESDVSIMISVKVVNQVIYDHSLIKFQPITNIKEATPQRLLEVYGDSFISGWQEGGEFLAVISIKAKNRDESQNINAMARVAFSHNKSPPPDSDKKELTANINAKFDKIKKDIAAENEVSVSVTWTGGGQKLKDSGKDWDFDTMKDAALKFPELCAKTPMRTHALLTKYTGLRSFYTTQTFDLPVYDKTGTYTNVLQEAYLDYKSILSGIQVLAYDVSEGTKALIVNPRGAKAVEQTKSATEAATDEDADKQSKEASSSAETDPTGSEAASTTAIVKLPTKVITAPLPPVEEPFAATIEGLEDARLKCRFMMNRIIQEIDNITIKPEIAIDEKRKPPYLSPFLFKMLLPLGVDLATQASPVAQAAAASKVNSEDLANKFLAIAG